MSILKRLFGQAAKPRIRVCVECGMPVAEHKDWCSILRGQNEMRERARAAARPTEPTTVQDPAS